MQFVVRRSPWYGGFLGPTQIEIVVAEIQVSVSEIQVSLAEIQVSVAEMQVSANFNFDNCYSFLQQPFLFAATLTSFTYTHRVSPCTPWYQGVFMLVFVHAEGPCSV